jgi:uncharacterized protein YcnI
MKNLTLIKFIIASMISTSLSVLLPQFANAHAGAELYGKVAKPNSYGNVFIRIPHAAKDRSTIKVEVEIPSGVTAVKPQQISGWVQSMNYDSDNKTIKSVTWSNGSLPDNSFADFGISLKWPNTPGERVYFKVIQTLDDNSTIGWIETPSANVDSHSLSKPAPFITLESDPSKNVSHKLPVGDFLANIVLKGKSKSLSLLLDLPTTWKYREVDLLIDGKLFRKFKLNKIGDIDTTSSLGKDVVVNKDSKLSINHKGHEILTYTLGTQNHMDDNDKNHAITPYPLEHK